MKRVVIAAAVLLAIGPIAASQYVSVVGGIWGVAYGVGLNYEPTERLLRTIAPTVRWSDTADYSPVGVFGRVAYRHPLGSGFSTHLGTIVDTFGFTIYDDNAQQLGGLLERTTYLGVELGLSYTAPFGLLVSTGFSVNYYLVPDRSSEGLVPREGPIRVSIPTSTLVLGYRWQFD